MKALFRLPALITMLLLSAPVLSQESGIHGVISDELGDPLSFATIYVKRLGTGTTANVEGFYEIFLPPGQYELVYQHLDAEQKCASFR